MEEKTLDKDLTLTLALAELGLGSILHAFHIPFSGQMLAVNQSLLISRALANDPGNRSIPLKMSTTAALVKAASPLGKRLTPMLAITMQGVLYRCGLLFGTGPCSRALAGALLALWAFIQPLLLYGWIFGTDLVRIASFANQWLGDLPFAWLVAAFVMLKMSACALVGAIAGQIPMRYFTWLQAPLLRQVRKLQPKRSHSMVRRVFYRLGSWPFVLSMGLAGIYYVSLLGSYSEALRLWVGLLIWACVSFWALEAHLLPNIAKLYKSEHAAKIIDSIF